MRVGRARLERALAGLIGLAADQATDGGNVFVTVSNGMGEALVTMEAGPTKRAVASGRGELAIEMPLRGHVSASSRRRTGETSIAWSAPWKCRVPYDGAGVGR